MKPFQIELVNQDVVTVDFEELKCFSLDYERKIETVRCCKDKVFTEACHIVMPANKVIIICNACVFNLYEMLYMTWCGLKKNDICQLQIFEYKLLLNKPELNFILQKLERYIQFLYEEHLSYDIFDNMSSIKEKLIQKFRQSILLSDEESEYYNSLTCGQKKEFLLSKSYLKTSNCSKKKTFSTQNRKSSINKKDFQVYCMIRNIPCKSSRHDNYRESVIVLINQYISGFRFSFCSDCLHNFGLTLLNMYYDSTLKEYKRDSFKVEYIVSDYPCLISGVKESKMYRVYIYNNVFVLSKKYFELLTKTIICSTAFKELFFDDYSEYLRFNHSFEISKDVELRKEMIRAKKLAETELQIYKNLENEIKTQNNIERENFIVQISDLKYTITKSEEEKSYLNRENQRLKTIISALQDEEHKRQLDVEKQEQKRIKEEIHQRNYFDTHILDCVKPRQSDYVLGFPKDKNKLYSGILKVTQISGFLCKTLYHSYEHYANAIIQTYRKDDPLCIAVCSDCLNAINRGLRKVGPNNTYLYDRHRELEIRYLSNGNGKVCHSCGKMHENCYYIRLCYVVFYLCEDCKTSWIGQMERVKFDLKNN